MKLLAGFVIYSILHCSIVRAAVPRPAWDCDDDKIVSKYYDEACTSDEDCFGRSMNCKEGKCKCMANNLPEERFVGEQAKQTVCVPAPNLFEECKTICHKPYVCKPHVGPDVADKDKDKKVCQCDAPFKLTDNYCHLECPENERYDSNKYICVPRCKVDEIKINETCVKLAQINGKCSSNKQCQPAYSECRGGDCLCRPGFSVKDGLCFPEELRCPQGQTVAAAVQCKFSQRPAAAPASSPPGADRPPQPVAPTSTDLVDDCPAGHFCHVFDGQGSYRTERSVGFCCPRVEPCCPVGRPHPTADCRAAQRSSRFAGGAQAPATDCPYDDHYCHAAGNGGEELCCPKRCDANEVFLAGRCHQPARLGDPCAIDEQCTDYRTSCAAGVCKCIEGATEVRSTPSYPYCSVECKSDEILHENRCFKALSLGDQCKEQPWRCPANSHCNRHNVCSCRCPRFTLSKDVCAPVPKCPGPKRMAVYQRSGMDMAVKGYEPISDANREELLKNVTFCTIPNKQAPKVAAVAECPANQYCAIYINDLGMCCKKPELVCPDGKKPVSVKNCQRRNPLSCGLKQFCHDHLYTADPADPAGKMCCEKTDPEDFD